MSRATNNIRNLDRIKTLEYYGAPSSESGDCTAAAQLAVDALTASGASSIEIELGPRAYAFTGTVNAFDAPVVFVGQGCRKLDNARPITRPDEGTWLIHDNTSAPLFTFDQNAGKGAGLKNVGIFQTGHATPGTGWAPTVHDWVIRNENTQGELVLHDVHFHNVYRGVNINDANRCDFKNITGQFFYRGLVFDEVYDEGTVQNFRTWTYWSEHDDVLAWTQANGVAVTLLRVDGMKFIGRFFTFAQAQSLYIGQSVTGSGTARVIQIDSLYADFTGRAIVVDAASNPAHVQCSQLFHLGQTWPASPTDALAGSCAVHVAAGSNHLVQIGGLYGAMSEGASVKVQGTNNQVWLDSTVIEQYDQAASGIGAFVAEATNYVRLATKPSLAKYGGGAASVITGATAGYVNLPVESLNQGGATGNNVRGFAAATGSPPRLQAEGVDTNIDLILEGKGTGIVRIGEWTSNADAAVNGYVTIKDVAGNTRKLATIA